LELHLTVIQFCSFIAQLKGGFHLERKNVWPSGFAFGAPI
jgi:hypothetical protein